MKVLFVDDDSLFLEGVKRYDASRHNEISLSLCATVDEARNALTRETFDAIIADIRMPGEDGISFLRFVQNTFPRVVRIILTAFEDESILKEARRVAHRVFLKPVNLDELFSVVKEILSHSE